MRNHGKKRLVSLAIAVTMLSSLLIFAAPHASACGFQYWYLPEGYTGGNFDTYILVQNPNGNEAQVTYRLITETGYTEPIKTKIKPNSRCTIRVDDIPGMQDVSFSTVMQATTGLVVERAMYFTDGQGRAGGSDSIGATQESRMWYLAEGYTGDDFDTYILVMNANWDGVHIRAKFMTPKVGSGSGEVGTHEPDPTPEPEYITQEYDIPAMRRLTIHVDDIPGLESAEVSTVIEVLSKTGSGSGGEEDEVPGVVAERAMYYTYLGINGGQASIGAPCASSTWYLPEGRTAGEYDTFVTVMNPNSVKAKVKATFMVPTAEAEASRKANPYDSSPDPAPEPPPDSLIFQEYTIEPYSRYTIAVDDIPGLEATDVATMIQSWAAEGKAAGTGGCANVVVERSMYFWRGDNGDGHNTIGATTKHEYWLLAEGYTAEGFDTWVLVMNPNAFDVNVEATFMTPTGDPIIKEYEVRQMSRLTIPVDSIPGLEATEVSTKLQVLAPEGYTDACEYGIIAERAMYFEYNGIVGGHSSLGVGE